MRMIIVSRYVFYDGTILLNVFWTFSGTVGGFMDTMQDIHNDRRSNYGF